LPESVTSKIRESKESNLKKVQTAFRQLISLRDRHEADKYSGKVDTAGFVVDTEERPIELVNPPERKEVAIDLNRKSAALSFATEDKLDIEPGEEGLVAELQINAKQEAPKELDVNAQPAKMVAEIHSLVSQDVEMEQFKEAEFENPDETEVEVAVPGPGELDVDLRQNMEV
jgi:hypothetical protein